MTIHLTASGSITLLAKWGHGRACSIDTSRPATILADDGDGHYEAWAVRGKMRDAAMTLAGFLPDSSTKIVTFDGREVRYEDAPEDFWLDKETGLPSTDETEESVPNLAAHPSAIAW